MEPIPQHEDRTLVSFDWAMKHILRDKANFDVLEGFLSALLKEDIHVSALLESEGNQDHSLDKFNQVDLLVEDAAGRLLSLRCNIAMPVIISGEFCLGRQS